MINKTIQIIHEASKEISNEVRKPKVIRDKTVQVHKYQLKEIEDALRMVTNSRKGTDETCMDRTVKLAYDFVKQLLKQ